MKKIDKRKKYMIVLDTETTPLDKDCKDVNGHNMLVYNIAWAVVDKKGNVYKTASYIVSDVFFGEFGLMQSAHYKDKIPLYAIDIARKKCLVENWFNIRKEFIETVNEFNVREVYAHYMRFDYSSINNTLRYLTYSKWRRFFPKHLVICDTLKMARSVMGKMPTYRRFQEMYGLLTKNGRLSFSAENCYKYISNNPNYIEQHKALEDVMIEKEILAYCYKQHKKMDRVLW